MKAHSDKVVVIPIGLDRGLYSEPPAEVVKRWRDSFGNRFFLFVGVFRYYKGLRVLLDAAAGADFPVVVVGAGPTEGELKAQARRLRLTNVHFLGALPDDDKNALLSLCHAVVLPSHLRSEAFGVSLLEGAMYAKPLISCEIGTGTSFVNIDGETGLVVPPSDSTALRAAMDALWQSPERAQQMGARALVRYRTHFTARNMAAAYAALYGELVETARRM